MPSTARAAWLDAWEGPSTPSPFFCRSRSQRSGEERHAIAQAGERYDRSVVRISSWQAAGDRRRDPGARPRDRRSDTLTRGSLRVPEVAPIVDYDWEAAARRRPGRDECERVILHADRSVEARISSTRHYRREAAARVPEPWAGAQRRERPPQLRVVRGRVPRLRLGLLAVCFAVFLVGTGVVTPVLINSAVTGVEVAVEQAEAEQARLAGETAALEAQIASLSSPQRVAEEAAHLGLVPANQVSYLSSGTPLLASEGDTEVAGR